MRRSRTSTIAQALVIFLLALLPRALAGPFVTIDEAYHWFDRVAAFSAALASGDYAGTNLIGHPGVTALWLGSVGGWIERALILAGLIGGEDAALHRALLRLPVAVACALAVAGAYPLLRRLLDVRVALLACLLWAGEPFLVAHGQLLHLDALLTSFMLLSMLLLLLALRKTPDAVGDQPSRWGLSWALVGSGAVGGLALLTKSPSVLLIPFTGLVLLLAGLQSGLRAPGALLRDIAPRMALWLVCAAGVWVLLWPAAWVDLGGALGRVIFQAQADGGSPHGWGNYFLGRATLDPGPLFYPVAMALRLSPWVTIGLLIALGAGVARAARREWAPVLSAAPGTAVFTIGILLIFALIFTLMMSIPPKKFDRYLLPVFPALTILAAVGWAQLPKLWVRGWSVPAALLIGATVAWYHPYELAYFNPLLGGSRAAVWAIPVGWGEGYEQAAAYVAAQPNGADRPIAALYEPAISPFAPGGAAPMDWAYEPGRVDYAVLYIDQIQRGYKPWLVEGLLGKVTPVDTVTIHGIEYAYVYQIAPQVAHPAAAEFGDTIALRGYDLDTSAVRSSGVLTLTLEWAGRGSPTLDYTMFVHVLSADGERIGQADVPPGGPRWPTSRWGPGRYISTVQRVPVRADAAAGSYRVVIGIYDPVSFARLPLSPPSAPDPAAGADALQVASFELP